MGKNRLGAWIYRDTRLIKTDFVMIDRDSVLQAIEGIKSINTYRLWMFILHRVNGFTFERKPEGYRLGEIEIRERTGLSRSGLYRSMQELEALGLIYREKRGKQTIAHLASHTGDPKAAPKKPVASHTGDAPAALDASQKPADCSPSKNDTCVSPEGPIPIPPKNINSPSSPSEREEERKYTLFSRAIESLYAVQLQRHGKEEGIEETWKTILTLLRKRNGIDGLHTRNYPMGLTRRKATLYAWLQKFADGYSEKNHAIEKIRTEADDKRWLDEWRQFFDYMGCPVEMAIGVYDKLPLLPVEGSPSFIEAYSNLQDRPAMQKKWREYGQELQEQMLEQLLVRTIDVYGMDWYLNIRS